MSKDNVRLKTLLLQGLSEPEFYGDLMHTFIKIFGKLFSLLFQKKKIIARYKKIDYNIFLRQTACLVVNSIKLTSLIARRETSWSSG